MKKAIVSVIILVLLAVPFAGLCEQTMEELDQEYDSLLDEYKRIQSIRDILNNGNKTYPNISDNYDNILDVALEIPDDVFSYGTGRKVAGSIYLVTGTVVDMPTSFDWAVDVNGKIIHIWPLCYDDEKIRGGAHFPKVGETANFYITFMHCFLDAVFYLDVTDEVIAEAANFSDN